MKGDLLFVADCRIHTSDIPLLSCAEVCFRQIIYSFNGICMSLLFLFADWVYRCFFLIFTMCKTEEKGKKINLDYDKGI